jgi:hypothetical protein
LFVAEFVIGEDGFDIEEDNREASDPVPSSESAVLKNSIQGGVLIRNSPELAGRVNNVLADLVGKLNYRDEVAYTKTDAHRVIKHSFVITTLDGRLRESRMRESRMRKRRE